MNFENFQKWNEYRNDGHRLVIFSNLKISLPTEILRWHLVLGLEDYSDQGV